MLGPGAGPFHVAVRTVDLVMLPTTAELACSGPGELNCVRTRYSGFTLRRCVQVLDLLKVSCDDCGT